MRRYLQLSTLILAVSACAAPAPAEPPGRDMVLFVSNGSSEDIELSYGSTGQTGSSEGVATIAACTGSLVTFGGAQTRVQIRVDGAQVEEVAVPAAGSGYFTVTVLVNNVGAVSVGGPALLADFPNEPQQPHGCNR